MPFFHLAVFALLALLTREGCLGASVKLNNCGSVSATSSKLVELSDSFTIEGFMKSKQMNAEYGDASILEKWLGDPRNRTGFPIALRLYPQSGRLGFMAFDGRHEKPLATSWTRVNDGKWHHFACVREPGQTATSSGKLRLFVDGVLEGEVSSFAMNSDVMKNMEPFTFGRRGDANIPVCYLGKLSTIRGWDHPKDEAYIKESAAGTDPQNRDGLIMELLFDRMGDTSDSGVVVSASEGTEEGSTEINANDVPHVESHPPASDYELYDIAKSEKLDVKANLEEYIIVEELSRGRSVNGRLYFLENADEYFTVLPPKGGCPNLATVGKTAQAVHGGCIVATNAGLFNTHSGSCHGNLISNGTPLQTAGTENANFGVTKDGRFLVGYLSAADLERDAQDFSQLISGMVWLVRNRTSVVDQELNREDMSRQETGNPQAFVRVLAPRLAVGHNAEGKLMILQFDGDEHVPEHGVDLDDMAELMIKYGAVNAMNLDGGSSDVVYYDDHIVNIPMHNCKDEGLGKWGRCEREVATILCIRNHPISSTKSQTVTDNHIVLIQFLMCIAVATLILACLAIAHASRTSSTELSSEQELRDVDYLGGTSPSSSSPFPKLLVQKDGMLIALEQQV